MSDIPDLPPEKRAQRYREMAAEADGFAATSEGPIRQSYLLMAEQWRRLAAETERQAKQTGCL